MALRGRPRPRIAGLNAMQKFSLSASWKIGLAAVRDYRWAITVLWVFAVSLVTAYYGLPGAVDALAPVAGWQVSAGWKASFFFCAFFCGVVPYVVYSLNRAVAPRRPLLTAFAQMMWCGASGVVCSWFFALQSAWFGDSRELATVLCKIAADQFGWTVLVIAPANALFYAVLAGGLRVGEKRVGFREFVFRAYLPNLLMNWCVGIPANFAVYSFPPALQVPVLGLVSSVWAVICVGIGSRLR